MNRIFLCVAISLAVWLSACATPSAPSHPSSQVPAHHFTQRFPAFHAVSITAPVNVVIKSKARPSYTVHFTGHPSLYQHLTMKVENDTLFVSGAGDIDGQGPALLNIEMGDIHALEADQANEISLFGTAVHLKHLEYEGKGLLQVGWIESDQIIVKSHSSARIHLAGETKLLNAELGDSSHLDARYLRAKKAFVNTAENSSADVWVSRSLNAFASNNSNIYYYNHPHLLGKYLKDRGSVLPMQFPLPPCRWPICKPHAVLPG